MKIFLYDIGGRQWREHEMPNVLPRVMIKDDLGNEFVVEVLSREENGIGVQLREGYIAVIPQSANYVQLRRGEF